MVNRSHRTGPHWLLIGIGSLFLALLALIGALGGPRDAWDKLTEPIWGHPRPEILTVTEAPSKPPGTYLITIRNPSLEEVVITGYEAEPIEIAAATAATNVSDPGGEEIAVVAPVEAAPATCDTQKRVLLARPIVVRGRRSAAIRVRPWDKSCLFIVRIFSNHGSSDLNSNDPTYAEWADFSDQLKDTFSPPPPPPPPPPPVPEQRSD